MRVVDGQVFYEEGDIVELDVTCFGDTQRHMFRHQLRRINPAAWVFLGQRVEDFPEDFEQ